MLVMNIRNILKNIGKKLASPANADRHTDAVKHSGNDNVNLEQRLGRIYGEDAMSLQRLYESWVTKESWLIKQEALPLLLARDPEEKFNSNPESARLLDELWSHAGTCVEQGLLQAINREEAPENWRAAPLEIYRWARISRIRLPDAFAALMDFVARTVKREDAHHDVAGQQSPVDMTAARFDQEREKVLGMALAILAAYPEQCRNSRGQVKVDKIVKILADKAGHWLGEDKLSLSSTAIRDLINKWLNTVTVTGD